ncbi:MAG: glycosyltransferase [Terracidiphilus sp.]|jgi:glycosyltransferase involved in cell wall biosynthesis
MALLTVGLPVRNAMPYLRQTVECLLSQTVSDFKVLAVVDECDDASVEFLHSVEDKRFQVVVEKSTGLIPTLNRMLREVDTPWLMRQDADDVPYPKRVERVLHSIASRPNAGMFASTAEYYPPERSLGVFRASRGSPADLRAIVQSGYLLSFCHSAVTLNVEKTLDVGGYRETLAHAEDADLWWRIALAYDIEIIPEVLVGYRQHAGQATTQSIRQNFIDLLYVQYLLLSKLWNRTPLSKEEVRPRLERFVSARQVLAKQRLRQVNIRAENHDFAGAIISGIGAFGASPKLVWDRIWDEVLRKRPVVNGIRPDTFEKDKSQFWNMTNTPARAG